MSTAQTIRETLKAAPPNGLTLDELHEQTGIEKKSLNNNLWAFKSRDEITIKADDAGVARYQIVPDFKPRPIGRPPTSFADILDRQKNPPHTGHPARHWDSSCPACVKEGKPMPRGVYDRSKKKNGARKRRTKAAAPELEQLALESVVAAGKQLLATVKDCIDYEDSPPVVAAIRSYELAEKIYEAAKA